jgi:hypothetical protein
MANTIKRAAGSPSALRYLFTRDVFRRNSFLALVVGCMLTLTNQLDVMLSQPFTARLATKIFFNFVIPFVVSSTSAAVNRKHDGMV